LNAQDCVRPSRDQQQAYDTLWTFDGMKRIRTKSLSPQKLREKCEKEAGQPCSSFEWLQLEELQEYTPESRTAYLLVDFRGSGAAIVYIHNVDTSEYVASVSSDNKEDTVIIPWQDGHFLKCYGACRVGEVKLSNEGSST
ncbi:hypothetical protein CI238_12885, partial [Colletotrichum incanum]